MSAKQDRQGVRTAAQLEQKYKFGESFSEVMGIASDAQTAAKNAEEAAKNPAANLTQDEVFNLLTDNGNFGGIYKDDNGDYYINAEYIKTGILRGLKIASQDDKVQIDLSAEGQVPVFNTGISTNGLVVRADEENAKALLTVALEGDSTLKFAKMTFRDTDNHTLVELSEDENKDGGMIKVHNDSATMTVKINAKDGTVGISLINESEHHPGNAYFRMHQDGSSELFCDKVHCYQLTAREAGYENYLTMYTTWEERDDGTWILVGHPVEGG